MFRNHYGESLEWMASGVDVFFHFTDEEISQMFPNGEYDDSWMYE